MIKNYFKTAIRNLWRNKTTSTINLFGLAVGMTAAVFIFLWVQNEISFDDYHPDKEDIFRIINAIQINKNEAWIWENSPMLMAETAQKEIPEVVQTARVIANSWGGPVFNINHQLYTEKTSAYIDKSWFSMFHYNFVQGRAAAFAKDPFSIILTESKAKKYFGNIHNVVGQIIRVDTVNYTVQGIIKDNPVNSSFQFDILMQMDGRLANPQTYKDDKTWNNFGYITFLKLHPHANLKQVEAGLNAIINKARTNDNDTITLAPLQSMYFENDLQSSSMPHGNRKTTYIFIILGMLLLVTACVNYVNLTTAKASLRAKEVSVRKIAGAKRSNLFGQFIAESLTISIAALLITLLLLQLLLPVFNAITEKHFELPLSSIVMWKILIGTLLFATILNGIYPAVLLSSFKPLAVFRGINILNLRDGAVRKGLVIFQFALSMILIVGAIVIYRQLNFIQTTNPGYNVSQIMSLQIPYQVYETLDDKAQQTFFTAMKKDLQSQSSIADVCGGSNEIVNVTSYSSGNADWDGRDTTYNPAIARLSVDAEFKNMFQLQMKQGRWFDGSSADEHNYILNETAATAFKLHKPLIGQRFTWGGDTGQVIGVVKDFYYKSLHEKIGPMVITNQKERAAYFFLKTYPGNIQQAISAAEKVWGKYVPNQPFTYNFLDDSFNTLYKSDIKTSRLILVFSAIAVIISALGLFGLAAFTAERRTKEIGIRKVLGASVTHIVSLLSKDFVMLVLIAILIASPLAWLLMNQWLQDFAYRINVGAWIFIAAGLLAVFVAIVSVSVQAIKAALANPVKSLRSE
ncbi:FtsX-like permease family protein [Ilyomonas limi]|uniref:FtsX-like permease family protein n=1 Tax=Ilyomonas limi TaxID=2575867 RepID=A0A4U3L0L2_9BACT|nr:ABC transporter permease [Ilyomonas limi]TKK68272.1 FtsX-like permease family protein [Ilyomonas limi]